MSGWAAFGSRARAWSPALLDTAGPSRVAEAGGESCAGVPRGGGRPGRWLRVVPRAEAGLGWAGKVVSACLGGRERPGRWRVVPGAEAGSGWAGKVVPACLGWAARVVPACLGGEKGRGGGGGWFRERKRASGGRERLCRRASGGREGLCRRASGPSGLLFGSSVSSRLLSFLSFGPSVYLSSPSFHRPVGQRNCSSRGL